MSSHPIARFIFAAVVLVVGASHLPAQEADASDKSGQKEDGGQVDLDSAVIERIDATTPAQLKAVSALLRSAIEKGLDEENRSFANKMLGSVLLQRSQQLFAAMERVGGRRRIDLRDEALRLLGDAVKSDPALVDGHLLLARLNLLGGDRDATIEAATRAIELLEEDPEEQSAAFVLRALARRDDEKRMADLDAAAKKDSTNLKAFQVRAALRLQLKDVEGAVADLEHILTQDPTNSDVARVAVQQLVDLDRVEEALSLMTKAIELKPSEGAYRIRAILHRMEGKEEEALDDLNKALALQPKDAHSLLQRAEIAVFRKDVQSAKRDLKAASDIDPAVANADQAVFVRCLISIEEGRMADAINDMKLLVTRDPANASRQAQLANLYLQDERPRKAIETYSEILNRDPNNAGVLRARADVMLSVGDHALAIEDYERALKTIEDLNDDEKKKADLSGTLNNLAWVLSTSPVESVRDGKRAIELGERAAKLTDYKEAHVLSTLAAGYAETGDFEKAIEWSTKSAELGRQEEHAQVEQLELELESYRKGEPWREKQETEENSVPILAPEDLIDT